MNFFKRCWQKRWIRNLAWVFVSLVTLCVLLWAWADWYGAREWRSVQAMLKAEGETLDFRALANGPIRDEENFCAIPLLKDISLVIDGDQNKGAPAEKRKRLAEIKLPSQRTRPRFASVSQGKLTDLAGWAEWLRKDGSLPVPAVAGDPAQDVLAALSKYDATLGELAEGTRRPLAQWTPDWKTRQLPPLLILIALPHLSALQGLQQPLALRSIAAARAGETEKAHEGAQILARLGQANLEEPFLIGELVGISEINTLTAVTWELCDAHAGTAEEFSALEKALGALDIRRATLKAWRSEMAIAADTLQATKEGRNQRNDLLQAISADGQAALGNFVAHAVSSGFFDANSAVLVEREFNGYIKPMRDDDGWKLAIRSSKALEQELNDLKGTVWRHPSYVMAIMAIPAVGSVVTRGALTQAMVNQAVIACALERVRLADGAYPSSLDTVRLADGKPLPLDPMTGQPMGYRRTAYGRYALWSAGFAGPGTGERKLNLVKPEETKFQDPKYAGDWVWDFPAK